MNAPKGTKHWGMILPKGIDVYKIDIRDHVLIDLINEGYIEEEDFQPMSDLVKSEETYDNAELKYLRSLDNEITKTISDRVRERSVVRDKIYRLEQTLFT